jgi:predicted TIM-barrel fold metal-dependent hydrolase
LIVDSHFHAWTDDCQFTAERGYKPKAAKPIGECFDVHDAHGVTHGVLVQPSFLGTDNSYMIACLKRFPDRLRASVVVSPDITDAELEEMHEVGVVGIRLNLISSKYVINHQLPHIHRLYEWAAEHGWHIEVFADGAAWADVTARLLPFGVDIVVDHFGMPNAKFDPDDIGHKAILKAAESGKVWVKFSGFYRPNVPDLKPYAENFLKACGPKRIVWASDFPWTGHEGKHTYHRTMEVLEDWVGDANIRAQIMGANAMTLFRFLP